MKHEVTGYALALSVITVEASAGPVELQVYQHQDGGIFAVDGSFLEQVIDEPGYIPDPFNDGNVVQLIDDMSEKSQLKVIGEEHDESLFELVLEQIESDMAMGDTTAINELLSFIPIKFLQAYLGDD